MPAVCSSWSSSWYVWLWSFSFYLKPRSVQYNSSYTNHGKLLVLGVNKHPNKHRPSFIVLLRVRCCPSAENTFRAQVYFSGQQLVSHRKSYWQRRGSKKQLSTGEKQTQTSNLRLSLEDDPPPSRSFLPLSPVSSRVTVGAVGIVFLSMSSLTLELLYEIISSLVDFLKGM